MEEMFFMSVILNVALGASVAICIVSRTWTRRCSDQQIKDVIKQYNDISKEYEGSPSLEAMFQNYLELLKKNRRKINEDNTRMAYGAIER